MSRGRYRRPPPHPFCALYGGASVLRLFAPYVRRQTVAPIVNRLPSPLNACVNLYSYACVWEWLAYVCTDFDSVSGRANCVASARRDCIITIRYAIFGDRPTKSISHESNMNSPSAPSIQPECTKTIIRHARPTACSVSACVPSTWLRACVCMLCDFIGTT